MYYQTSGTAMLRREEERIRAKTAQALALKAQWKQSQIEISINVAEHVVRGHVVVEVKGVKQSVLLATALSHHAGALPWLLLQLRP